MPNAAHSILLLTHADTDAIVFVKAIAEAGDRFSGSAVLPLQRISHADQLQAILRRRAPKTICICRLLGNVADVPGLTEALKEVERGGSSLIVLSGTAERKPEVEALSTVAADVLDTVWLYFSFGGLENVRQLLVYLTARLDGTPERYAPPQPLPDIGIYHPRLPRGARLTEWQQVCAPDKPTVGISFYRAHWLSGNLAFVNRLVDTVESAGMNCLPVFSSSTVQSYSLFVDDRGHPVVDAIINTTSFAMNDVDRRALAELNVPVVQAITTSMSEEQWWTSTRGLNSLDTAMNVAMPEFDGRIISAPISAKLPTFDDTDISTGSLYKPLEERIDRVVGIVKRLIDLRKKSNSDKRIAFVFTNASSKASQIGNAVGLDAPQSLMRLLQAMQDDGYIFHHVPESADRLIHELLDRCSYDETYLTQGQCERAVGSVNREQYKLWFEGLATACQDKMVAQWGAPPGSAYIHNDKLLIAGIDLGNAIVVLQPPRGYGMDPNAIYHQPDLPPTHHYFAVYKWLDEIWGADAIVHVGKHGTLEWLPGKGVGLSAQCFPDAFLADMPLIYPFIINDPGEGSQAKRRAHSVIIDHLPPPLTTADTYGVLAELTDLVDDYYRSEALDPAKLPILRQQIWELIKEANLNDDLKLILDHDHDDDHEHDLEHAHAHDEDHGADDHDDDHWDETLNDEGVPVTLGQMDSVKVSHLVQEIDGYLCELGLAQIRDGLHILGEVPEGTSLVDTLSCLSRLPNEGIPGLHAALAEHFGFTIADLLAGRGQKVSASKRGYADQLATRAVRDIFTNADVIEALDELGKRLLEQLVQRQFETGSIADVLATVLKSDKQSDDLGNVLRFACEFLVPKLRQTSEEIDNTLRALNGEYIQPGPSGAPSRGMAHILPTGRNFYSVDPRSVPSPSAWTVGVQLADEVLRRFQQETRRYPESVCISVWGTSAMRTHGDDIAEILALLGVQPRWQKGSPRIAGLEVIPLSQLGRPRIDVTVRISGLFRDAFPHLIALIDEAVNLVIDQEEEPLEQNFVRKHYVEEMEMLKSDGLTANEADRRSRYRIFGSKPGTYGAGILSLMQEQNWSDEHDIAEVYLNWGSFAYNARENGREARSDFSQRLQIIEVALHNQDNREHDIFDSDDYFQYHGGLIATVRALSGNTPKRYFGDSHDPSRAVVRDLQQETLRVFRSRVVNPKWIESIKRHGYKGALELSATVDYLFGYDATAGVMQDWMYEQVAQVYALNPQMQQFLQDSNPWALKAISERLLEAAQRQLWEEPSAETLSALKAAFLKGEATLEQRPSTREEDLV